MGYKLFLTDSILKLGLSERTRNALFKNGIIKIEQLLNGKLLNKIRISGMKEILYNDDLLIFLWGKKGIGKKSINEIKRQLNNYTYIFSDINEQVNNIQEKKTLNDIINSTIEFIRGFNEREREITKYRLNFLNNIHNKTLQELALEFGISQERVRQIENNIKKKLITFLMNIKKEEIIQLDFLNNNVDNKGDFKLENKQISNDMVIFVLKVIS